MKTSTTIIYVGPRAPTRTRAGLRRRVLRRPARRRRRDRHQGPRAGSPEVRQVVRASAARRGARPASATARSRAGRDRAGTGRRPTRSTNPAYSAAGTPASSSASTSWAAVTPDPQYAPTAAPARTPELGEPAPQLVRRQEPAVAVDVAAGRRAARARGCARRPGRPARPRRGNAPRARASSSTPCAADQRRAGPASSTGIPPGRTTTSPGVGGGTSVVSGRPAAVQAASPPSSTRTSGCPAQRSSHQARAALLPSASSYATTGLSASDPRSAAAPPAAPAGSGSGCRPPRPSPTGAARSRRGRRRTAPGRWPDGVQLGRRRAERAATGHRARPGDSAADSVRQPQLAQLRRAIESAHRTSVHLTSSSAATHASRGIDGGRRESYHLGDEPEDS